VAAHGGHEQRSVEGFMHSTTSWVLSSILVKDASIGGDRRLIRTLVEQTMRGQVVLGSRQLDSHRLADSARVSLHKEIP
jgi:hypothetical protein